MMLYDTGGESFTGPVIERGFVRWRQNGISAIDLLIVSHGDADQRKYANISTFRGITDLLETPVCQGKKFVGKDVHIQFLAGTGHRLDS